MLDLLDLLGLRLEPFCIQLSSCKVIVALGRTPTAPAANVADARLGQHIRPVWHLGSETGGMRILRAT
jgi:hypothetical protein